MSVQAAAVIALRLYTVTTFERLEEHLEAGSVWSA